MLQHVGVGLALLIVTAGGLLWLMLSHLKEDVPEIWLIAVVLSVFALLAMWYVARLTQRLRFLMREMEKFHASDFSIPPELESMALQEDEVGQLSRTLVLLAEQLQQQLARIQHDDQARRELIANVSHDLRTPLASMRGYLDTLVIKGDTLSGEERHTYLSVAVEQANRLAKLIGDLFDMAKLEAPNAAINAEPCAMAELVQDVVQKFQLAAGSKQIQLQLDIQPDTPWVLADIGLLERVLSNLLDNALSHSQAGGAIRIGLCPHETLVRVKVRDNGKGIDPAHISRIFDPFFQANSSRSGGGAGLGLSIVRRILQLHGSNIQVESTMGQGACFYFDLPGLREFTTGRQR